MDVQFEEDDEVKQEYRVVSESSIESLTGTALEADMPENEVKALPYYAAKKAEYTAGGAVIEEETITQSVESVFQISEWGNVVGVVRIDVVFEMQSPPGGSSYVVDPSFSMLLPYFWKTGIAPGGEDGSIHEYFQADGSDRYWTEIPNLPSGQHIADEPNFDFHYFGGLDTLVYMTGGSKKIGIVWPGADITQYDIDPGYNPHDGNGFGATVSAKGTVQTRSQSDEYEDSSLVSPGEDGKELMNNKWWNIANVARAADPANNVSAINGSAFVIKGPDGQGNLTWQAWAMDMLVGGASGSPKKWEIIETMHLSNTGIIAATVEDEITNEEQLALLLPVSLQWRTSDVWDNVTENVDPFTNEPLGYRVFPGSEKPDGEPAKGCFLDISASGPPNLEVFLKVFDVDDRSDPEFWADFEVDGSIIDPNDSAGIKAGDDNLSTSIGTNWGKIKDPSSELGVLRRSLSIALDSNGKASLEMFTTPQPGNNYRVSLSVVDDTELELLQVSNSTIAAYVTPDDSQIVGSNTVTSPLLTVWRKLNVEADSLGAIPTPKPSPDTVSATGNSWSMLSGGRAKLHFSESIPGDDQFYAGGFIEAGSYKWRIFDSDESSVTINPAQPPSAIELNSFIGTVLISDDDDIGLSEDVLPQMPPSEIVTDAVKKWYSPAYIEIVEVSSSLNSTPIIPFVSNTNNPANIVTNGFFDNATDVSDPKHWSWWYQYHMAAFQPHEGADSDGSDVSVLSGINRMEIGLEFSATFSEVIRETVLGVKGTPEFSAEYRLRLSAVTAHEIGHSPGRIGNAGHLELGLMRDDYADGVEPFFPLSILRFRNAEYWSASQ
jgi:hypothetical protein